MIKEIKFENDARESLKKGIDKLTKAVSITLGPKGRNVIIEGRDDGDPPRITKDGVSVAKSLEFEDPYENRGAQIVKDVSIKTEKDAADGTTTATILAHSIVTLGLKNIVNNSNPMDLKKGIDKATNQIVDYLEENTIDISENPKYINQVATVSSNGDEEMGKLIASAIKKVTKYGDVTVEESNDINTTVEYTNGLQYDDGFISPYFINDENKQLVDFTNPYIFITNQVVQIIDDVIKPLEYAVKNERPLVIIAPDFKDDAIKNLVINNQRGAIRTVAVKAPEFGDRREEVINDLSILTGAKVLSYSKGHKFEEAEGTWLGECDKVIISKYTTTLIGGKGDENAIEKRTQYIKDKLKAEQHPLELDFMKQRLAKFIGGIATIFVGANSAVEISEKKDRVDDALGATKAAIDEGIVPGGGVALIRAQKSLDSLEFDNEDEKIGIDIIRKAIETPLKTIAENAGEVGEIVLDKVKKSKKSNFGYNARKDIYEDLLKAGIIDPKKVTRLAIQNAASVAGLFLTTECAIINKRN